MPRDGMSVTADAMWGQRCVAYNVQAGFSEDVLDHFGALQKNLTRVVPNPLHVCPRHSLHVSIYALVPVRWPDSGKDEYWSEIAEKSIEALRCLCRRERFTLQFNELRVTPAAIVAVAADISNTVATFRECFDRILGPWSLPRPGYTMIHTTLARFERNGFLSQSILDRVSSETIRVESAITEIDIVHERTYPALHADRIATYGLSTN